MGQRGEFPGHGAPGRAVLAGERVVSACHAVCLGDGRADLSIDTQEAYRRRGLATLAASAFIEDCLARGVRPEWSCWSINEPSVALALKLGFIPHPPAEVHYMRRPQGE